MQNTILPQNERLKEMRVNLFERIEQGEFPSIAIVVSHGEQMLWQEGLGWADCEQKIKTSPHHLYPIASLTKSMTATGMIVLVERGLLHLDEPAAPYLVPANLTAYAGCVEDVTLRQILNMTAGIPHGWLTYDDGRVLTGDEFVNRFGIITAPPGQNELYSNFSYGVAEAIISRVSGQGYTDFMQTAVFEPLGMTHTSVHLEPDLRPFAVNKYGDRNTLIPHVPFIPLGGAGCYASVHDLWRYGRFHLKTPLPDQKPILSDELLDLMHTVKAETLIGLGWGNVSISPGLVWSLSNGQINGANSMLSLIPDENIIVAVLINHSVALADEIAIQITDAILPSFAETVMAFIGSYEEQQSLAPYQPTPQLAGTWQGSIQAEKTVVPCSISFSEDDVHIQLGEQPQTLLNGVRYGNNKLQGSWVGNLPNGENFQGDQEIALDLRQYSHKLSGTATATFRTDKGSFCLPTYVQLVRQ